jgi:hypothetical protein
MKVLKVLSGSVLLYLLCFSTGTQLSSCQKDPIIDTLIVKDTVVIRDTVDCNCYDLKDGLVAWYNFKNGTLGDSSGKGNHIAFNNATKTTDRNGNANGAYLFNGTSSYMKVLNSTSINPTKAITLAAIIKLNGFYTGQCHGNNILAKALGSDYNIGYYALRITDHNCNGGLDVTKEKFSGAYGDNQNGGPYCRTDTSFAKLGQWYNIVYTYENGQSKFYINGELKDSRMLTGTFTPNSADLFIGKFDDSQYPYWFNGVMDDIRIYNRALCEGEVKQLNRSKD